MTSTSTVSPQLQWPSEICKHRHNLKPKMWLKWQHRLKFPRSSTKGHFLLCGGRRPWLIWMWLANGHDITAAEIFHVRSNEAGEVHHKKQLSSPLVFALPLVHELDFRTHHTSCGCVSVRVSVSYHESALTQMAYLHGHRDMWESPVWLDNITV